MTLISCASRTRPSQPAKAISLVGCGEHLIDLLRLKPLTPRRRRLVIHLSSSLKTGQIPWIVGQPARKCRGYRG